MNRGMAHIGGNFATKPVLCDHLCAFDRWTNVTHTVN